MTLWHSSMGRSVHNSACHMQSTMGSWRGLMRGGAANHDLSHVEVRHTESCQRVAVSEGVKVLLEQLKDASERYVIHELCEGGLGHLVMESGDAPDGFFQMVRLYSVVDLDPRQKPLQS